MVNVDLIALLAIQVLYAIASLALISVGLAIIFGMMRVINLAHGEFLMLGGYAAIVATSHGISIWIAILVVAPVVVGILGVIIERTIIRFLYGRMIDTMLATWGLSLFLVGLTTAIFGNTTVGISAPIGPGKVLAQMAYSTSKGPAVDRRHTTTSLGYVYSYDSVTDVYVIGSDDRIRNQTRGVSYALGARYLF